MKKIGNQKVVLMVMALVMILSTLTSCKLIGGLTGSSSAADSSNSAAADSRNSDVSEEISDSQSVDIGIETKWPAELMGNLPVPDAKIVAVLKDEVAKNYVVAFSNMSEASAEDYANKFKALGYSIDLDMTDAKGILLNGSTVGGAIATFTYALDTQEGSISYHPEDEVIVSEIISIDMTDADSWPAGFISGVPELAGKITSVSIENDEYAYVNLDHVDKSDFEAFVNTLKQAGYTVDADESKSTDSQDYSAYNAAGDWIYVTLTIYESGNSAQIEMQKYIE